MAREQAHWDQVYTTKAETEVSWFQADPAPSVELIEAAGATRDSAIIDIGGGASRLADQLLERGHKDVTVLDLSAAALDASKARLGTRASAVQWIVSDVTTWEPDRSYDVWHDRATFHFLTDPADRSAYLDRLLRALKKGGHAIVATFAEDGPDRCSGLPVIRYSPDGLAATMGTEFQLVDSRAHLHRTPWGSTQSFQFSLFERCP